MTTALTLFDLADLTPTQAVTCGHCGTRPAGTRVYAVQNLLGTHPAGLAATRYRDAAYRADSGPCCDTCAWTLANAWWAAWLVCPTGTCFLWLHTGADPRPAADCRRHHDEHKVVWTTRLEVAA